MRARPSPPAAAGFVGQALYPVLQKPLRPFVDKAPSDPYHLKNRGLKAHALAGGHDGGNLA
jgi:hypothetical protein